MKPIVSALLTLAVFVALAFVATTSNTVRPVYAQGGCSVATLNGNYGFSISGFSAHTSHGSALFPFYAEGLGTFDGAGGFSATFASSFNGTPSTGNFVTATYTVNSDCTGLLTVTGADNFAFVIVSGGAEILASDVSPGTTDAADFKRQ